jgi:hypothetical protein
LRKLWPLKVEGSKIQKNKPPNATKIGSQTPTKFLVLFFLEFKDDLLNFR